MKDADPELFSTYIHSTYTEKVDVSNAAKPLINHCLTARLWALGDMLIDHGFCNASVDMTIRDFATNHSIISPAAIDVACEYKAADARLRQLFVKMCASAARSRELLTSHTALWPSDFVLDVAQLLAPSTPVRLTIAQRCRFHLHPTEKRECEIEVKVAPASHDDDSDEDSTSATSHSETSSDSDEADEDGNLQGFIVAAPQPSRGSARGRVWRGGRGRRR